MGKCLWCDKDLDGPEATVCPSCVFRPISEAVEEQKKKTPEGVDPNFDLSVFGIKKNPEEGKRSGELVAQTLKASMVPVPKVNIMSKVVKVKSRKVRGRSIILDGLVLTFDDEGFATILEADVHVVEAYNRVRPGRLSVVREEAPAVAEKSKPTTSLPKVQPEPVVSEEKPEEKPEEKKPAVKKAPAKKATKKAPSKKRTTKKRTTKKTTSKE